MSRVIKLHDDPPSCAICEQPSDERCQTCTRSACDDHLIGRFCSGCLANRSLSKAFGDAACASLDFHKVRLRSLADELARHGALRLQVIRALDRALKQTFVFRSHAQITQPFTAVSDNYARLLVAANKLVVEIADLAIATEVEIDRIASADKGDR